MEDLFERTILIVDDEAINREILGNIIQSEYKVIYAENGKEALEIIQSEASAISLVLLDLLMPVMDGNEVLKAMKEEGLITDIPVIVLTSEKSSEIESLKLGAADFLTKPYDLPEVILARVRHSIQLFENSKIIHATEFDKLTLLYSPEFFFGYASQFDQRFPNTVMDALVINFTHFHLLNQLKGRNFGDSVLTAMADGIRKALLKTGGIAGRNEADCFYLYIPHADNYNIFLDKITETLSSLLKPSEIRLRLGAYTDNERKFPMIQRFDHAVQACNSLRIKTTASTDICIYDDKMAEKEVFDAHLLQDFEAAIEQKQFKVVYQPKFNITGDKAVLCSAEALVRWVHPELGFVRPDLFIPLFEENGLVTKLDRYVWEEAARQIAAWKKELGVTIPVSVNVSRVDIAAPDMTDFITKIVKENDLSPSEYHLEITESAYTSDSKHIIKVVENLRALGHKIEMDDFGSGYSSLNMLTDMPIDVIKMDKAFIRNIQPGNKAMHLVELVLDIAKYLEVPVVAEGVETEEELKMLKEAGCDIIQGYYFSKPIPPEEMSRFV
ncbi:EAL domain, c-di-GMP-specific phosphodiesterase class I (or its enzymatically inactive variant) [Treponema bryantii]|uniref:EAL domain, c-di-GMP-specific phosphodiesterase class I (Or its enzymatically inactive variant) n=1 Tax=Treponema bryantii TaxID=163 RepID=A0A1I3J381_9SPIR|nr:EAL domain-containing response regulator [Treponema bryantii]SFI54566.1 EAL domain, c-di-GMP-specific phosphodiesterase class I (or its enzymatically inactive variant) [Treponema bryantii]